jgi:hypothetical protein
VAAYTNLTAQTASKDCIYLRSRHADLQKPVENRSERDYESLSPVNVRVSWYRIA